MNPVISVIVEGYNESQNLGHASDTIAALEAQDFPLDQVELIMMGSGQQVAAWERGGFVPSTRFAAVRFVGDDDAHYLQLKNRGAQAANGDILAFTDSDVRISTDWLSSIVSAMKDGAVVSAGLSTFVDRDGVDSRPASRLVAGSITWGWTVGKGKDPTTGMRLAGGSLDHNLAIRREVFVANLYEESNGRLMGSPLLFSRLRSLGHVPVLNARQQAAHYFDWRFWLVNLHVRYGYETYMLRRIDPNFPNRWLTRFRALEPVAAMGWRVLLDLPQWWRYSGALGLPRRRRLSLMPLVVALSTVARGAEAIGMWTTMISPKRMRRWAETR
jgi:hypothetical protein